ncbi:glycoside hydrolase family 92 protein [Streptomyces sp. NBC_01257]|nr:glycoside hydrolase family 92 protein [Streptomyces sp. NBC_01257]
MWPNDPAKWGVGNDDLGTMSAWYVWSAMGFYPETPGTSDLALGSPLFTHVDVTLGNGRHMVVNAPQAADNAPYVQSATLNGANWNNAYLPADFATGGGTLDLALGTGANTGWATGASSAPPSYNGDGGAKPPGPPVAPSGPVTSANGGKCLDDDTGSTTNGNRIQIWTCNNSAAQQVTVTADGSLRVLGKCVEVTGNGGAANGTLIELWDCNGGNNQKWTYKASTGALVNPQSGRCLDVPNASTADGTQLEIWDCHGGNNQKWSLPS